jgi:hypothetical protein
VSTKSDFPSVTQSGFPGETQSWRDGIVGPESHTDQVYPTAWRDGELFSGRKAAD